jgi:acetyltransferase-like isoleucine patch superfamily enzyme
MSRYLDHDWFPESLPDNVELGERSWLYSTYAFCHYQSRRPVGLRIGRDTGLYNGTFFDLGPDGEVAIGNFCTVVGAIICSNGRVEIGDYAFIAHEVVIADTFAALPGFRERHSSAASAVHRPETARITVRENVWIGARAVLLDGADIGEGSIVGAASVVDFHVPPFSVAAGNPARIVKKIKS